ncbi:MAG: heme oxygenase [Nitrobacter sp.]
MPRPARLLEALRSRTRDLHVQAERSGVIADILRGQATRDGYALLLRNLLPVYHALEEQLTGAVRSPPVRPLVRPELARAAAIREDLNSLAVDIPALPVLPVTTEYVDAIVRAGMGDGGRLVAHAYARYLGDLSGGQILKRLLARSLDLLPVELSFYDFSVIDDVQAFKADYRAAIDRAGDVSEDFDAIVEEGALAFELNIALSVALQAEAARGR